MSDRDETPDLYADGFSITAGPFGVTITLHLSDPTGEPGPHEEPNLVVGRVRVSRDLARALSDQIGQALTMTGQARVTSGVKH